MSILLKKRKYLTKEQYNKIKITKEGALCSYCKKNEQGKLIYYIIGNDFEMEKLLKLL